MDEQSIEDLFGFLRVQNDHTRSYFCSEQFKVLIPLMNDAYEATKLGLPAGTGLIVIQLLLLCHRSFLLAVSLIGGGHPNDAGPVTRRAIEMARIAFALTYDSENFDRWISCGGRGARGAAREAGGGPPGGESGGGGPK